VPLGAVPALSWCGEVPLGGILIIIVLEREVYLNRKQPFLLGLTRSNETAE